MKQVAEKNKAFAINSAIMLTRKIMDIGLGLATVVLIARMLGKEGQGVYALVILLPTIIVCLLNFGITSATVYFTSKKKYKLIDIINTNIFSAVVSGILGIIIGSLTLVFAKHLLFKGVEAYLLWIVLIGLPAKMIFTFLLPVFMGLQDFKTFNFLGIVNKFLFILLVIALYVIKLHVVSTIWAFVIADYLSVAAIIYLLNKKTKLAPIITFNKKVLKSQLTYGIKAHINTILTFLNYRLDMFLVGAFINTAAVGIYSVAVSLAERIWLFSQSIAAVLMPSVSGSENDEEKNNLTCVVNRNVLFISIVISLGLFVLSGFVIDLLFGKEYQDSILVLRLLIPGIAIGSITQIITHHIFGVGKPEINMYCSIGAVILNVILNVIFIPIYGVFAAAVISSITYSADSVVKIIYFKYSSGRKFSKFLLLQKKDLSLYLRLFKFIISKISRKDNPTQVFK